MFHRIAQVSRHVRGWLNPSTRQPAAFLRRDLLPLSMIELESRVVPASNPWGPDALLRPDAAPLGFSNLTAIASRVLNQTPDLTLANFRAVSVDLPQLKSLFATAPLAMVSNPIVLALPTPGGGSEKFKVWEVATLAANLAVENPDIRTYRGQGVDDPYATLAADVTLHGFHASVLSPTGSWYIDPYYHLSQSVYAVYDGDDLKNIHASPIEDVVEAVTNDKPPATGGTRTPTNGSNLRTFRLAVAGTVEYTAFHGGTVALGQSAMVTTVNRVNQIYERDLGIHLNLVYANSYTGTDPYTSGSTSKMIEENQANLTSLLGGANYDLGHVFDGTNSGGLAAPGVGNAVNKARATSTSDTPNNDAFYIRVVAHEMGHQFGANHTFNGVDSVLTAQREPSAAYEPGAGSTIMSYGGGTIGNFANQVVSNIDSYFHFKSLDEITNYVGTISSVGTTSSLGNIIPTVAGGIDYIIPAHTPFALTGGASDLNGDSITYDWEQYDLGPSVVLGTADSGTGPLFRSFPPTISTTRFFPRLATVLAGQNGSNTEVAVTTNRTLNFKLTARDNRAGGGAFASDNVVITSVNTGAAFAITNFNSFTSVPGLSSQTLTWNVAGTTANGINAANVTLSISHDGGATFAYLSGPLANTGSANFQMPNVSSTQVRLKVSASNNIFYDINNANFTTTAIQTGTLVTNDADSGNGSLRAAVIAANAILGGTQDITFDGGFFYNPATPRTIILTSGELAITDAVRIVGPGAKLLTVSGNKASRIFNLNANTEIQNLSIIDGVAANGGGMLLTGNKTLLLNGVDLKGNSATTGGALRVDTTTSLVTIYNSNISGNTALRGGGIYFNNGGGLLLENSTISGNLATDTGDTNGGGGLYFFGTVQSGFVVRNATIANNTANSGGGVVLRSFSGSASFQNSTLTGNVATGTNTTYPGSGGGGIAKTNGSGSVFLQSTIVSGNSATNGRSDIANITVSADLSAIGVNNGFAFLGGTGNLPFGTALNLGKLGDFGGPVSVIPLLPGSPAINAGYNPQNVPTDSRGNPFARVAGTQVDIGAYEYIPLVVDSTFDGSNGNFSTGGFTLREALLVADALPGKDTVTFSPTVFASAQTISLAGSGLLISNSLTVAGPTKAKVTISGVNAYRVLQIEGPGVLDVALSNLTITQGNSTNFGDGGGLFISDEIVTLDRVVLLNNTAGKNSGGGIAADFTAARITIRNSTLSGNSAVRGGGIYFFQNGGLLLENSTISGNVATGTADTNGGGGIYFFGDVSSDGFVIRNSTIARNTANSGGGVALLYFSGDAVIQNSTISGNSATSTDSTQFGSGGGGISQNLGQFPGRIVLTSSILSGNSSTNGRLDIATPTSPLVNFSAVGSATAFASGSENNLPFAADLKLSLIFFLVDNGGAVETVRLEAGSAAIDKGSNPLALLTDGRGVHFARLFGATADIGAYEVQNNPFAVDSVFDGVDGDFSTGQFTLREAVTQSNRNPGLDTIQFSPNVFDTPQTITLTGGPIVPLQSLIVAGPNTKLVTIHGGFDLTAGIGTSATLARLTLTGGGVVGSFASAVTLSSITISGSTGTGVTGGVLNIFDSTISGNANGGVIPFASGTLLLRNSTISGNTGGGVSGGSTVTIQNSTITANTTSGAGGGVSSSAASFTITSSIVSGNTAKYGSNDIRTDGISGNQVLATFSALGSTTGAVLAVGSGNNLVGAALNLGTLQFNGGQTPTHALGAGSKAIDAGSNPSGLTTDQRSYARTIGAGTDIGAVERQLAPTVTSIIINNGDVQRSRVTSLAVSFSAVLDVNPSTTAFSLTRLSDGANIGGISTNSTVIAGHTVITLFFSGANTNSGSLADGNWTLLIQAGAILSAGSAMESNFSQGNIKRIFGDADGNGTIDASDFAAFGNVLGATVLNSPYDYDGNGSIDASDFSEFGNRFGFTLV